MRASSLALSGSEVKNDNARLHLLEYMYHKQAKKTHEALKQARSSGRSAFLKATDLPDDTSEAYAISFAQVRDIAAWKIGGANPWSQSIFNNSEIFFGPLRPNEVFLEDTVVSVQNLQTPLAEPEIMLELAETHVEGVMEFSRMAIGFEIPASVMPERLKPMLSGQIVDRAGAGALWIAGIRPFERSALQQVFSSYTWFNEDEIIIGSSANLPGGPLGVAEEFLRLATHFGAPLRSGQWLATGGLSPAVPVFAGDKLRVQTLCWDVSLSLI